VGGVISNSYSTGNVIGQHYVGGLVGKKDLVICSDSFWDNQTSGQSISVCGIGKTTAQMQNRSTFIDADWNFTSIWGIAVEGESYPHLIWEGFAMEGCSVEEGITKWLEIGELSSDKYWYCDDEGIIWNSLADSDYCSLDLNCPSGYQCFSNSDYCEQRTLDCINYTNDGKSVCEEDNGCYWLELEADSECVDSNDLRLSCSYYDGDETSCNDDEDNWNLGAHGFGSDICDGTTITNCKCIWKDGACKLTYNLKVYDDDGNYVGSSLCLKAFWVEDCINGKQDVGWQAVLDPPIIVDGNPISDDNCKNEPGKSQSCGQPIVKLPGFSWINIVGVMLLIGLFYLGLFFLEKRKPLEKEKL